MLWSRIAASLVMLISLSSPIFADSSTQTTSDSTQTVDSAVTPPSSEQRDEEKELEQLKPEEYRLLVLGTQIYLGRFGYGVGPFTGELDEATQEALREYQQYVGIPETGNINKETLKHLTDDNSVLDRILPFLPRYNFEGDKWEEVVSAYGTWALENLPVREALQTSQISCHKTWKLCTVSTAKLTPGYTPTLVSHTNIYEIATWDDSKIISKPSKTGTCLSTTLRIQRKEESVIRISTPEKTETGPCAKVAGREVQMQLADGSQIYRALKNQKNKDAQRILRVKEMLSSDAASSEKP